MLYQTKEGRECGRNEQSQEIADNDRETVPCFIVHASAFSTVKHSDFWGWMMDGT